MRLSFFIARRLALTRQKAFSGFIIRLAMAATALSVAVMIVALSFANGFQQVITQKVFSFWGHIRVQQSLQPGHGITEEIPINRDPEVEKKLLANSSISSVEPYAGKSAILMSDAGIESVLLKGIDSSFRTDRVKGFLSEGKMFSFPGEGYSKNIVLSKRMADRLMLQTGDSLLVFFFREDGTRSARRLSVSGIYHTGIDEYDRNIALCDINLIRRLNNWEQGRIAAYEVFLKDPRQTPAVSRRIYEELPQGWYSKGIDEIFPNIFDWLGLQEQIRNILLAITMAVAIANLITCLIILVLERTRMTGLLKALGTPDKDIREIFLFNTAYIAGAGILIGIVFGLLICWLQEKTGFIQLNEEAYFMKTARAYVIWWQVLAIAIISFLICMISLVIPSYLIRKINVIKAIQFR